MDIRGSSAVAFTPPPTAGRQGSSESNAEIRQVATDSVQERKEAEASSRMRQTAAENRVERVEKPVKPEPTPQVEVVASEPQPQPQRVDIRV